MRHSQTQTLIKLVLAEQFGYCAAESRQHFLVLKHVVLAERAGETIGGEGDDFAAGKVAAPNEHAAGMQIVQRLAGGLCG